MKLAITMIIRKSIITLLFAAAVLDLSAQEQAMKREVTLYNPYKPSLNEARKRSFLPEITDTARFRPDFTYDVTATPFMPEYAITPIKPAALQPDPLSKLYKGYVKMGLGNPTSPLAEFSLTNERSRKGAIGFYGRHYSNNGKLKADDGFKSFAGYMDNEASLFGRKFFRGWVLGGAVDYNQATRYAYGRIPEMSENYFPEKQEHKLNYYNAGANLSVTSASLDSNAFAFDYKVKYNYFHSTNDLYQHHAGLEGMMAKTFRDLYLGAELGFDFYNLPDNLQEYPAYLFQINPFVSRRSDQWQFRAGLRFVIDRDTAEAASLHLYPDIHFGFSIVKSYVNFFTSLTGRLEQNRPLDVIGVNPFLIPDGTLFRIPNTSHQMVVTAGLKGNSGIGGSYVISGTYSLVNDMTFFTNMISADTTIGRGNYFTPVADDVDLFTLHAKLTGQLSDKLSFDLGGNYYNYTLTALQHPWSRPEWDASLGFRYNLREKILAGIQLNAVGARKGGLNHDNLLIDAMNAVDLPYHVNLNLSAEYRFSRILSFWTKFNNISWNKYYDWAYYPSQRYLFMVGFTYSL